MHLALEGEGPPTEAQWIGQFCEAFHCLPSQAYREWLLVRDGLLEEIIEARAYANAKRIVDSATTATARKRLPRDGLFGLVSEIEFGLARKAIAEKQRETDGAPAHD